MKGIILFSCALLMVISTFSSSPLKMSLSLASISTILSMMIYQTSNSAFIPCAMIISFSSGMMILFSYCSMMSNHESKNNFKPSIMAASTSLLLLFMVTSPISTENNLQKMVIQSSQTTALIFLMMVVIISMICMNLSFFNPTKKFMQSY